MSPVSRGRRKKNRSTKGPVGRRAPVRVEPEPWRDPYGLDPYGEMVAAGGPSSRARGRRSTMDRRIAEQARAWWPASHAEVLDAAPQLLGCASAEELADATAALLGEHWRRINELHSTGFWPSGWLDALLDTAAPRAGEPAVRRLVHGIATIAAPDQADHAAAVLRAAAAGRTATGDAEEPAWLDVPTAVEVSPDVLVLRDGYGLRFGLVAQVSVGDAAARSYLFDVDVCHGFAHVVRCGHHADAAAAIAAWRDGVGASAADTAPEPLPADLLPHLLTGPVFDGPFSATPSGDAFREVYRVDRIALEIYAALEQAGRPVIWPEGSPEEVAELADDLTGRFREWAAAHDVDLPPASPDDVVRSVLGDWVEPNLDERLALACSPHRIAAFVAYLNDAWDTTDRDRAVTVLEPWARYCLECSGVTGEAATHALAWAARAATDPEAVGGDHGNDVDIPFDETLVIRRG